ncbi:MAG: OmpA family protein [Ignavibacterium sp.]|jgi:outer membrane protein OmpA-like peptidoglycan-associated protein|nr:OmpA family protein [Ignavibacterium sp.]
MKNLIFVMVFSFLFCTIQNTEAQIFDKIKKETEKIIKKEAQKQSEAKKEDEQSKDVKTDENTKNPEVTNKSDNTDATQSPQEDVKFTSSTQYDFVPGDKVILFDDFSQDAVGDFPALWTTNSAGEINTVNIAPGNWFNLNSTDGNYFYLNDIDFPKNFIIEFDIIPKTNGGRIAAGLLLYGETKRKEMDNNPHPGNGGIMISIEKEYWNTWGYKSGESEKITGRSDVKPVIAEKVNHVIIWVQGRRLRIYHQETKVLDMPTNLYADVKLSRLCFRLSRGASCGSYLSNLRITDAAPDMRSKLITEGKLVSYGIYFDVNKDVVKSESFGTIKEIAKVLTDNPDVKIKIVGHTDSDGDDKSNLDLSKRRADAVKNVLVKEFGMDGARIETDGKGEGEPVAKNDSVVNKALNRRVEFLKL